MTGKQHVETKLQTVDEKTPYKVPDAVVIAGIRESERIPPQRFKPGQSGNPSGVSKIVREAKRLAAAACPEAIEKLKMWMRSDDHKASIPACMAILDRGLGKVKEAQLEDEDEDLSKLSDQELLRLALQKLTQPPSQV